MKVYLKVGLICNVSYIRSMTDELYTIDMDSECLHQDFDDVDLYGEKTIESDDTYGNDLMLE